MKIQEMIDVLKAYQQGKEIQIQLAKSEDEWEDAFILSWNFHLYDYRVKPELKPRRFELIKEFPLSPSLGTIVEFKTEQDFNDGIHAVGAIPSLMLKDCIHYPGFWEELLENKYTKDDDLVGRNCFRKSELFLIKSANKDYVILSEEHVVSREFFYEHYKVI